MAIISSLILELRTDLSDDDSTRWTDAKILNLFKKAIRRANRVVQRNGLQFAKKQVSIKTIADQAFVVLSTVAPDFDVWIGLWRDDIHQQIKLRTEHEWEEEQCASALGYCMLDDGNDKILFDSTPSTAQDITLWYYPKIDPSTYTVSSATPWDGRLDDIIMEYVGLRLKNIDEMDIGVDRELLIDMENQILSAYLPNSPYHVQGDGWL